MRVLLAHNHYRPPSGENVVFENERKLLQERGVEVITYERHNAEINQFSPLQRLGLAWESVWSKRSYAEIKRLIKETRPDIAHFHNTFPLISASAYAACKDSGVPVVQTLHNYRLICPKAMLQRNGKPCEDCIKGNLIPAVRNRCYKNSFLFTLILCLMLKWNKVKGVYLELVDKYIVLNYFAL